MSTPPINIPIIAEDLTGPGFARAAMGARLLNKELDLGMSRTLTTVISQSRLIGPLLNFAFAPAVAIGFFTVAYEGGKKLYDIINDTAFAAAHFKLDSTISKEFEKAVEDGKKLNRELQLAATANPAARAALEFKFKTEDAKDAMQVVRELEAEITQKQAKLAEVNLAVGGRTSGWYEERAAKRLELELEELYHKLGVAVQVEQNREAEAGIASVKALKDRGTELAKYKKLFEEFQANQDKMWREWKGKDLTAGPVRLESITPEILGGMPNQIGEYGISTLMPDPKVADEARKHFEQLGEIWKNTRTDAEKYRLEVAALNELFNTPALRGTELYKRALEEINLKYSEGIKATMKFGQAIGDAMKQGALLGSSWMDVLKSLLVTLIQVTLQMTLLHDLESQFGKGGSAGGWGGFATALVGGFTGFHASGGYIGPGMWGIVGENGPEVAFGGASGLNISPSGVGGVHQYFDMRGSVVSSEVVHKAELAGAMRATHDAAVKTALTANRERAMRGIN